MSDNNITRLRELEDKLHKFYEQFEILNNQTSDLADKMYALRREILRANRDLAATIIAMEKPETTPPVPDAPSEVNCQARSASIEETPSQQPAAECKVVATRYCSFYDGGGISIEDTTEEETGRSLFVIEIMADDNARFYPCFKSANRIINNLSQYQGTLCDFDEDVTVDDFMLPENAYGALRQDAPGHWVVSKRCRIARK